MAYRIIGYVMRKDEAEKIMMTIKLLKDLKKTMRNSR